MSSDDAVIPKRRRVLTEFDEEEEEEVLNSADIPFAPAGPSPQRLRRIRGDIYGDNDNDDNEIMVNPEVDDSEEPEALGNDENEMELDYTYEGEEENEEEEDGEDLMENAMRDYQRIEALDTYGTEGIDDREYEAMDPEERIAAEREIERRSRSNRTGTSYFDDFETEEDEEARAARRKHIGRRRKDQATDDDQIDELVNEEAKEEEEVEEVNMEAFDVPLREWIAQDRTRREIQRRFRLFLSSFREPSSGKRGPLVYEQKIKNMASNNGQTLEVSYLHLTEVEPTISLWLADAPSDILEILNETATRYTLRLFPSYGAIRDEIIVRISEYPILDSLRNLRRSHLETLVKITGVVTRRSAIFPQIKLAYYDCLTCNNSLGPFRVDASFVGSAQESDGGGSSSALHSPQMCGNCQQSGPFKLNPSKTQYRNYQRVTIQETPGTVPPGRVPRSKMAIFSNDLCDRARPGEEIEVSGVYSFYHNYGLSQRTGFQVFDTQIHANHVVRREDLASSMNLSESDRRRIMELGRDPNIGDRIIRSMAPSIYGHRHVKTAIAMSLFSGVPKNINDKHRIRGDINVLLLGDPGTAKSQVLKYAEKTAPRAVYSTGKGASAVGLTASVHKDPVTKEWTLEGGALVLADRGMCLIDEFDKMNEQDRTSIHEAMEQQSISVSKAGIVTSLQARCSVIAAANPIGGRYDSSCTLGENVELTDPILQRFDILCVLQDTIDPVADERLASFVVASHIRSKPTSELRNEIKGLASTLLPTGSSQSKGLDSDLIPQDLLRKYIQYARTHIRPQLRGNFDQEKIASLYVALRKESAASGGVPIAVRHIESIMRMAEAHAKMHLREHVREDDMDAAIKVMLTSFVSAQKFSVQRSLQRSFDKFISTGNDRAHLLLHILQDLFRKESLYQTVRLKHRGQRQDQESQAINLQIPLEDFEVRAKDRKLYNISEFLQSKEFHEAGYVLDIPGGLIRRR